jgi:hypothetical protein
MKKSSKADSPTRYTWYPNRRVYEFTPAAMNEMTRRMGMTAEAAKAEDAAQDARLRSKLVLVPWVEDLLASLKAARK